MNFWKRKQRRVYADAAAATPLSLHSRGEMLRLLDVYGNAGGLHREGVIAKGEMEVARKMIAETIGAHSDEIIFTASGTEGNNLGIDGVLRPLLREHKSLHAITCAIEHASVLEPLRALKADGLSLTELQVDSEGLVSAKMLAEAITPQTVFVSIQLINPEVGTIEPLRELAKEIRKVRESRIPQSERLTGGAARDATGLPLYFHTDASQAPLWMKVGVPQLGVDLMTLDAQKVLGPKGVGVLFIKRGTNIEPLVRGGVQEKSLRAGTPNVPLYGAFAVALQDAQAHIDERVMRVSRVRDYCWAEIKKLLPDAILNGPHMEHRAANNINVSIPGLDAQMAVIALDALGISAATRSACNAGDEEPSHVIKALGTPAHLAGTAVRITFLPDVTRREALRVAKSLAEVAKRYRIVV